MNALTVDRDKVLVVVPTYNEAENLPLIIERVRAACPAVHVLVVDDSSPDGTGRLAEEFAGQDAQIHVLHRVTKEGLGRAYLAGFDWGIAAGYEVLVEMDADGSHQPEQLERLLKAIDDGADFVLGSRWVPGGSVVNWPFHRELLSRGGNLYARLALGVELRDITGGYRAMRTSALAQIDLDDIRSAGYCFQVDMAWRAVQAGLRVTEVPIEFVERVHGTSKMSGRIVFEALVQVGGWGLHHRASSLRHRAGAAA